MHAVEYIASVLPDDVLRLYAARQDHLVSTDCEKNSSTLKDEDIVGPPQG
jgi:hypothetical protein